MSQPLYLSYFADEADRRWGLSLLLEQDRFNRQPHEWLGPLHAAADGWQAEVSAVFLRSELGIKPEPGCRRVQLPAYLFASGTVNGPRLGRHLSMIRTNGTLHRFTLRPGAPVEGPDLVGREGRASDLLEILKTGSCHLRAPRRYGKTSLLRQAARQLAAAGTPAVFTDVSSGQTVRWFFVTVARAVMESPSARAFAESLPELAAWPGREAGPVEASRAVGQLQERIAANPWSFGRRLLVALGQGRAVLLLDEFSVFLREAHRRDPTEARDLAALLADARRSAEPTLQVLAGSAGLSAYLHFHGLGPHFQDLSGLDLPPLTAATAGDLAEELLYGAGLLPFPEAAARVLEHVGEPVPYFLHAVINAVVEEAAAGDEVDSGLVDRAYSERILGTPGNELFKVYNLRARPYPPDVLPGASRILGALARNPQGVESAELRRNFAESGSPDTSFDSLLSCLQEDFDLVEREGRWVMRCKVLRDRWMLGEPWLTRAE